MFPKMLTHARLGRAMLLAALLLPPAASFADERLVDTGKRLLSSHDAARIVNEALPWFHGRLGDESLTPLVRAAWLGQRTRYPGLSWKLLATPEVRLPLGQLWCQWLEVRGARGPELAQPLDYGRRYLSDAAPALREAAISLLGSCGEVKDLDALVKAARTDPDATVQSAAVFAIYAMLREKSRPILVSLRSSVTSDFVRTRIDAILQMIPN